MSTPFRDSFESCPRCGIDLVDARDARGCQNCGGLWLDEAVLTEMILTMLPPPPRIWGPLALAVVQRAGDALACPSCGERMEPTTIHQVELDSCPKHHGVWFDADELRLALRRVADPANPSLFAEPVAAAPTSPPPSTKPQSVESDARRLVLRIIPPESDPYEVAVQRHVIKIGTLASAHVRLDDELVSRMHAIIEVTDDRVSIIDLGSSVGTLVNGERTNKSALQPGDQVQLGETVIDVVSIT